jgi:acetyl esterase/lipase
MALAHIYAKLSLLPRLFQPATDAVFSTIALTYRWRLILLQPLTLLAALLKAPSFLFNTSYRVVHIPTRSGPKRCLIFQPPRSTSELRPLHIDLHGGGFFGGFAEQGVRWCELLAKETGSVVVSGSYRLAPRHVYPAANEDVEDMIAYLAAHAGDFGADADLLTLGGSSAGGTLTLGSCTRLPPGMVKAWIGFCAPVDLRTRPRDKVRPAGYPKMDPLAFLEPLFDAYAGTERERNREDGRCHPTLVAKEHLPPELLFVCAGVDILLHEQRLIVERLRGEKKAGDESGVEMMVVERALHGFVECESSSVDNATPC